VEGGPPEKPREERSLRDAVQLGYELSRAHEFDVFAPNGRHLSTLERLRYERHADYPDEIVVRSHRLLGWPRRLTVPFEAVGCVDLRRGTMQLRSLA
jgi:hypothetical protein